ncbi:hypothetical protein A5773_20120 [Mycobacterium sp. 852014-52450_SCH5900713]|nr:hypothetical protein A5773_20120 [Mycobacterium sp. 852014-52450_SCH5900713]
MIPEAIRRVTGHPGTTDGLIEIPLVGHAHRYRVRIDNSRPTPRLVELQLVSDDDAAEIDPNTIRQIPIRRLAKAAARFIILSEHGVALAGDVYDQTSLQRPDAEPPGRRKRGRGHALDDVHYRQVARLLLWAREIGESPREYVADRLGGSLPAVDRWIAEAKRRGFLRRDWATAADPQPAADTSDTD